jgi:CRP-like cAMP-binding protein
MPGGGFRTCCGDWLADRYRSEGQMSDSLIMTAFWMGIVSAVSLPMGALASRFWTPSDRATAMLMAFGGGALLAALTIDLVASALERGHFNALALGAVGGGLLFVFLNQVVNDAGGFVRKTSTTFYHLRRQEHRRLKRIIAQVTRSDLFTGLSDSDYKALAASFASVDFPKGSAIFEAGDPADAAYIVASGAVEIYDRADRSHPLARLGPNEVFGWYSTLTGAPTSDTAIAAADSCIWVVPKETLDGLQRSSNSYVQVVHRALRGPDTLSYLIQRQGMTPQAAQAWLDRAAQSLMRAGRIPSPAGSGGQADSFVARLPEVRRFPFLQGLPADELGLIANRLIHKIHAEGEQLFIQGQPASRLVLIERGRVSLIDPQHSHREPDVLQDDDAAGGLSFLTGAKHTTTAVATEETAVWELRRRDLDELLRRAPRLAERIRGFFSRGEAADYLSRRLHIQADHAARWCRAAERALDQRQPIPPAAALILDHAQHGGAPIAIFLGITLDGIPESLVIGSSMLQAAISVSLIVGLFLSNFPEALSSSVGMRQQGMGFWRILGMWSALMLITGVGAAAGSIFFEGAGPNLFAITEGLAAGAMLTMIAETMLPEAYLKGGNVVGLSTLAGFLIAIFSKTLEPAAPAGHGAPPAGHGYRQEASLPVVAQTSVPPGKVPP